MEPEDVFIKVQLTAYFAVEGKQIEKREFAHDSDLNGIYLNGKRISPDIDYYTEVIEGDVLHMKKLPPKDRLMLESVSYTEQLMNRVQIWKEDRFAIHMDEKFEKRMKEQE